MSALRKTMEYLGLAEVDPAHPDNRARRADDGSVYDDAYAADGYAYDYDSADDEVYDDTPASEQSAEVTPLPRRAAAPHPVREMHHSEVAGMNRIVPIHPRTYNEAKTIGESFRDNTPVIMNLTDMDDADAKRLVDFAAGLVFGLHGSIERVTSKVFLLSPAHIEVAAEEPGAVRADRTIFNQS